MTGAKGGIVNQCGGCRFWGKRSEKGEFKSCRAIVHDGYEWADDYPSTSPRRAKFLALHKAVVQDDKGLFAVLKTRVDFACVLWEAKA